MNWRYFSIKKYHQAPKTKSNRLRYTNAASSPGGNIAERLEGKKVISYTKPDKVEVKGIVSVHIYRCIESCCLLHRWLGSQ